MFIIEIKDYVYYVHDDLINVFKKLKNGDVARAGSLLPDHNEVFCPLMVALQEAFRLRSRYEPEAPF